MCVCVCVCVREREREYERGLTKADMPLNKETKPNHLNILKMKYVCVCEREGKREMTFLDLSLIIRSMFLFSAFYCQTDSALSDFANNQCNNKPNTLMLHESFHKFSFL